MAARTVRSAGGRVVGQVAGDVLTKHVKGSIHMLREPRAWAVDVCTLEQAERFGARWVLITDDETGSRYRVELAVFWRDGIRVSRGFGEQRALPLAYWQRTAPGREERVQLTLWGG